MSCDQYSWSSHYVNIYEQPSVDRYPDWNPFHDLDRHRVIEQTFYHDYYQLPWMENPQ